MLNLIANQIFFYVLAFCVFAILFPLFYQINHLFPKQKIKISVTFLIVLLTIVFWKDHIGKYFANIQCQKEIQFIKEEPLLIDGFLLRTQREKNNKGKYSFSFISKLLLIEKFRFIEINKGSMQSSSVEKRIKGIGKFYYFYIDNNESEYCISNDRSLLKLGLKQEQCLAAKNTKTIKSEYRFKRYKKNSGFPAFITWKVSEIKNLDSGKVYSRYKSFSYGTVGNFLAEVPSMHEYFSVFSEKLECGSYSGHKKVFELIKSNLNQDEV